MPLFVSNLSVPFDTPLELVYAMARTKAKLPEAVSAFPYVVKVSLDARRKSQKGIRRVYTVGFDLSSPDMEQRAAAGDDPSVRFHPARAGRRGDRGVRAAAFHRRHRGR